MQVTTAYIDGLAMVDYNCMYDSPFYQAQQRALNKAVLALCPDLYRYYNTPSVTLTARDYFPNYDELARIKSRWDPAEVFRIYQGIRPVGFAPDAYELRRPYVRESSLLDRMWKIGFDTVKDLFFK